MGCAGRPSALEGTLDRMTEQKTVVTEIGQFNAPGCFEISFK